MVFERPLPLKILGMGRYLPERVVTNAEVEALIGLPSGTIDKSHAGVRERRWVTDETGSFLAAMAAKEALRDAGFEARDLDLIINGSGTQEQAIPDGGPLIQRHLGLEGTGIPAFSTHSTCLSFLVGLNVAANFLASGQYGTILVTAGDIASHALNPREPEAFMLFGDAAAAVVVTRTPAGETSGMSSYVYRTFGEGAYHTAVMGGGTRRHPHMPETRPEDNLFHMDGKAVYLMAVEHGPRTLAMVRPSLLTEGLGGIKAVVPHQASGLALDAMTSRLQWPAERIAVTIDKLGNTIGASIPVTLVEARDRGMFDRGDEIMLFGTGAGLSIGAAILTY
ncbi:MAG: 3-oxoacyl-[acyl-carrier-protein] synthase III C-terminal domain-containing protein [Pseudomonadota bacterium]